MIDELVLIKELLGDLTHVGGWAFAGYIAYSLTKMIFIYGGIGYILNKVVVLVFDYIKCPVTKSEYDNIQSRNDKLERDISSLKHQYVIMKEKKENEQPSE